MITYWYLVWKTVLMTRFPHLARSYYVMVAHRGRVYLFFKRYFFRQCWCFCKWHARAILIIDTGSNGHVIKEHLTKSQKKKKKKWPFSFFNNVNTPVYCLRVEWEARFVRAELFLFRADPTTATEKTSILYNSVARRDRLEQQDSFSGNFNIILAFHFYYFALFPVPFNCPSLQ